MLSTSKYKQIINDLEMANYEELCGIELKLQSLKEKKYMEVFN